jgi:hypothetical protein
MRSSIDGSGANFFECMFLSGEALCGFQAANTAARSSGAVVALPVRGLRLDRFWAERLPPSRKDVRPKR